MCQSMQSAASLSYSQPGLCGVPLSEDIKFQTEIASCSKCADTEGQEECLAIFGTV